MLHSSYVSLTAEPGVLLSSKREANAQRDEIIGQLHAGTYIVYGKIKVADFMEFWLEEVMRPKIADNSYNGYKNVVYNYVTPQLG